MLVFRTCNKPYTSSADPKTAFSSHPYIEGGIVSSSLYTSRRNFLHLQIMKKQLSSRAYLPFSSMLKQEQDEFNLAAQSIQLSGRTTRDELCEEITKSILFFNKMDQRKYIEKYEILMLRACVVQRSREARELPRASSSSRARSLFLSLFSERASRSSCATFRTVGSQCLENGQLSDRATSPSVGKKSPSLPSGSGALRRAVLSMERTGSPLQSHQTKTARNLRRDCP